MSKQVIRIFLFFTIIGLMLNACDSITAKPEEALWGKWEYVSQQDGDSAYFFDLEFLESGVLSIDNTSDSNYQFVIIAPGRLKISSVEDTQILNYEIADDTLTLFFNNGINQYQRLYSPITISELASETPTITAPAFTPTAQPPTPTLLTPTISLLTETPSLSPTLTETPMIAIPEQDLTIGSSTIREMDGMLMLYIPAGSFTMGSSERDSSAYAHEKPQHEVELDAFWMDAYEVSNAMFRTFVEATGYRTKAEEQGYSDLYDASGAWDRFEGVNWQHPLGADTQYQDLLPVTHVNQYDALAYCQWVGSRLPTEAEWEKAARGGDGRIYPWGNTFNPSFLRHNSSSGPASILSHPEGASPYGVLNMAGNVFEWTSDWYDAEYYAYSPHDNPTGPPSGEYATIRGGAWTNSQKHVRTTHRDISMPHLMNHLLGFRCVMDP